MLGHDRFEALGGAVALGEATPDERAAFDAHATFCAECRADVSGSAELAALFEDARAGERWRPSIDDAVVRRIRESRRSRSRLTIGALGWCVALSLVVDVAFASGFAHRLGRAFDTSTTVASVAAAPVRPAADAIARAAAPAPGFAISRSLRVRPRRVASAAPPVARHPASNATSETKPSEVAIPDVLAGLDLYGTAAKTTRSVAFQRKEANAPDRRP